MNNGIGVIIIAVAGVATRKGSTGQEKRGEEERKLKKMPKFDMEYSDILKAEKRRRAPERRTEESVEVKAGKNEE